MNVKTTIATLSILSALSFSAFAAQPVTQDQAANLQAKGMISVSGVAGAPSDIRRHCLTKPMQKALKLSALLKCVRR